MLNKSTLALAVLVALAGCDKAQTPTQSTETPAAAVAEVKTLTSGIELSNMDTSVKPAQDFFRYVNGNWLAKTEIPADKGRWGSFDELRENADKQVLAIVQELAGQTAEQGTDTQKISDFYRSYMDTATLDTLGLEPLKADFTKIEALASHADLATLWGELQAARTGTPVVLFISQDQKASDQYITLANQSGLGMPDRDYYLNTDEKSKEIQQKYQAYISKVAELAGWDDPAKVAATVYAIESKLAEAQWSRVQNRDRNATYNKLTLAQLAETAPGFDWAALLGAAKLSDVKEVVVRQPTYLTAFAKLQKEIPVADWQSYLKFHLVRANSELLASGFDQASFEFYGKTLSGLEAQREREKRAVAALEGSLGFMLGKIYVERHFKPEAKERMDQMIKNMRVAFKEAIDGLEWMTPETKKAAQEKLSKFNAKIGYPDVWRDYSCLEVKAGDLVGNIQRSSQCEFDRMVAKLGQPVDRTEWGMTPQTVNAYYSSTMNEIVFPAAILQPPFFNVNADDAVNYGAIGGVIGHEITHGFDDQGRRSDGNGNLTDWWKPTDAEQFQKRAQLMIDQYSAFNPIDDLKLQGALGLGENIADLGGLTVAFKAYQTSLQGKAAPVIDGFSGDQRFFMGWSQVWRIKFRDASLRQQVITGPHSPGMYRVLGVLSNMPEFYQTFDVKPGDGMYRDDAVRVKIW
ncbi:Putative metalloendopeptidase [Rheinheimera sp. A13L]|uniref:M13 family metallopeptidase n=1 Tax=Rheinheimera sp. A13L TaxID=506534 RepID=UPI0002125004|nr:M13-type metalloendopeptidase [Rheinheimera sp. A13L]EGM77549.1 Putative metalloendopeptidase [Rheinheimera sp. A13L]